MSKTPPAPEASKAAIEEAKPTGEASKPAVETPSAVEAGAAAEGFFYVYCVVDGVVSERFGKMGIGGRGDEVYGSPYKDISAIVSRTDRGTLERDEENMLAHQRVIQKIFSRFPAVPLPFSSILESEKELVDLLSSRYVEFHDKLEKLQEIVQPVCSDPSRELVEEALAESFANALKIRQLSGEIRRLQGSTPTGANQSRAEELVKEVSSLRQQLQALRSADKYVTAAVSKARAIPVEREGVGEGKPKELGNEVQQLRHEFERIKKLRSDASRLRLRGDAEQGNGRHKSA